MKRFVEFYSGELGRKVRIPVDISIVLDESTDTMVVDIPRQIFGTTKEATLVNATFKRGVE